MRRVALIVGLCVAAAACGSTSHSYTVEKTQSCLVGKGFKISHNVDFVASTATGGSLKTFFPNNDVTVVFGTNESDAANLDEAYRRFRSENVGIDDVLYQNGNAVLLWHFHPSDADSAKLTDCLR